jgi:AraC-like DNA-binding protein
LFYGVANVNPAMDILKFGTTLDVSAIMLMPCFYLYFTNIIYESKFELGNLLHFIVPVLLGSLYITAVFSNVELSIFIKKLFFFTALFFYIVYAIFGFLILKKHIWQRKTFIKTIQKQNKLIKNWSIFLYVSFIAIVLIRAITGVILNKTVTFTIQYVWISAIVWISIFIKIILTPEILYGYDILNKTIDAATKKLVLNSVWNLKGKPLPVTTEKDLKLKEKIRPSLKEYLHQIEEYSFHSQAFRNSDLSMEHIAIALKIPVSYIHFILKFHCNENFTDYKKIVRIHDATKLIEKGFLNDHKVELLAAKVGFTSYNTFSIAFKNITGVTTQEYLKRF